MSQLQRLEAESIEIFRAVAAECARPALLHATDRDSAVLLHLARKAFHPGPLPFPLLHVDTTGQSRESAAFRDRIARELGVEVIVHTALERALDAQGFTAVFAGGRRDRPELWGVYNTQLAPGASLRVFPLSDWTDLDLRQYIERERIAVASLHPAQIAAEIAAARSAEQPASFIRFVTCGDLGAGKSTLIARLLRERGLESHTTNEVAYHAFSTARRGFVVVDTPGHERHTRDMAAAASTAELAVVVVDAANGVVTQTRRHTRIVRLMGIRQVILAVNKMDRVGWSKAVYDRIEADYRTFCEALGFESVEVLPVSAVHGENVVEPGTAGAWHGGPTLSNLLEQTRIPQRVDTSFRMPVQWVSRPDGGSRGLCGRIAAGSVSRGDRVRLVPSGQDTTVKSIVTFDGELDRAREGQAVTLVLADDADARRGDVVCSAGDPVEAADQFEAHVLWLSEHALVAGRLYTAKINNRYVGATVTHIKYGVDVDSGAHLATKSVAPNDIAVVNLSFDQLAPFEAYDKNHALGGFVLIDRLTHETVGAGMLHFALRRAANIHWQAITVDTAARAASKGQRPRCIWFTGLSASGKSTIADLLDKHLHAAGYHTFVLDGDNVRHGLNRDLGFTEADRVENNRRVAEVARLMVDAGLIVIVSFISPFKAEREFARSLFAAGQFVEVFVDTPLEICEARDPKGLYAKARHGDLKNFTGFDSPYEPPDHPEFQIRTTEYRAEQAAELIARSIMDDRWARPRDERGKAA